MRCSYSIAEYLYRLPRYIQVSLTQLGKLAYRRQNIQWTFSSVGSRQRAFRRDARSKIYDEIRRDSHVLLHRLGSHNTQRAPCRTPPVLDRSGTNRRDNVDKRAHRRVGDRSAKLIIEEKGKGDGMQDSRVILRFTPEASKVGNIRQEMDYVGNGGSREEKKKT